MIDLSQFSSLAFYAVQNSEGKWFRRKGYGGRGETWVDDIAKARIWNRTAGARTVVGWFANHYPQYGVPNLVKFTVSAVEILDEAERMRKAQEAEAKRQAKREERERKEEVKRAEQALVKAQERLARLRS